jgi:hypothetical protein
MPAIRQRHATTNITIWLQKHHQMGLWSSLLFALTICLAGFIWRTTGRMSGIYENIATFNSICIIYLSLVLITVCCYEKIHRPCLFTICFVATTIWASITLILSIISVKEENIFLACWVYAFKKKSPWKDETNDTGLRISLVQTGIAIVVIIILLSIWLALRWYQRQEHRKPAVLRLLVLGVTVLSAFAACNAIERLYQLLLIRYGMDILWKGETGYNNWGVGQIGAPLAWAPLLINMIFDGLDRIRNWWYGRCLERIRLRVLLSTRALMLQIFNGQREEDRRSNQSYNAVDLQPNV